MNPSIRDYSVSEAVIRTLEQFASREAATVADVISLARQLPSAFINDNVRSTAVTVEVEGQSNVVASQPAVPIENSWDEDSVTCLCCGRSFTMLKRHLKAEHGLSEADYRAKYQLPEDHPLTAPNYSLRKAEHAKQIGLGKYSREDDLKTSLSMPS